MNKNILISNEQILDRVDEIASDLEANHPFAHSEEGLLLLAILKGGANFALDLQRALFTKGLDTEIEYAQISSYGEQLESSGQPIIETNLELLAQRVTGRDVVVVEDIIETGHTLAKFLEFLQECGVNSTTIIVLLAKDVERAREVKVDYVGFKIPGKKWVEGYGIDTRNKGRGGADILEVVSEAEAATE